MSRHKLVKSLDLDEELDDFDGGTEGDLEDDLNAEDKGTLPAFISQRTTQLTTSYQSSCVRVSPKYDRH